MRNAVTVNGIFSQKKFITMDETCTMRRLILAFCIPILVVTSIFRSFDVSKNFLPTLQQLNEIYQPLASSFETDKNETDKKKTTIAYAVSITNFNSKLMYDGAAVVHQSIRLASKKSRYDYHMIAFVHPDAKECAPFMKKLGYEVQIRETPFNETEIKNPALQQAQRNSCCGAKEYLKLYSYLQFDYPVVVHLDLDTMVLKPMDEMFDLMLDPSFNRSRIPAMWLKPEDFPSQVDFLFTRDYNMVDPPRRQPHQIGVQGGFLVIRPNAEDFERYIKTILSGGDFVQGVGWGGQKLQYGGYYGAGTIQGLASYYFGHLQRNRSVELNRCYYNTMVDNPYNSEEAIQNPKDLMCRTLEPNLKCDDCRKTDIRDIYTAHFTVCGKPQWCQNGAKGSWKRSKQTRLCFELFREWHKVRRSLEDEWRIAYPPYDPMLFKVNVTDKSTYYLDLRQGHCNQNEKYIPMEFPGLFENNSITLL